MSAEETRQASAPASKKKAVAKKARATKKTAAPATASAKKVTPQSTQAGVPAAKKVASQPSTAKTPLKAKASALKAKPAAKPASDTISLQKRNEMIATMAYHLSEKRGFAPGWELEDWLESERVVDKILASKNVSIGKK